MHHRKTERAHLMRKLEQGISLKMPGPRRIGKTWTIKKLATDLRTAGWVVVETDVEGIRTQDDFARALCKCIEEQRSVRQTAAVQLSHRLKNFFSGRRGDSVPDALSKIDPIEFIESLMISLDKTGKKTAIIIDEIAYFFLALAEDNAKDASNFAYKLRALQQRYQNVRWLLTGSIGLDLIARRYGFEGAFVDFETYVIDPFTPDQARSYMRDPAIQQQFTNPFDADDADFDFMFKELGWLAPYYIKMIANEVRPSITRGNNPLPRANADDFNAAFKALLDPTRRADFAVWREHIQKNLPKTDHAIARSLLDALSPYPDGETEHTLIARIRDRDGNVEIDKVREILAVLINDGLVSLAAGRYTFRSGLIRQHWHAFERTAP